MKSANWLFMIKGSRYDGDGNLNNWWSDFDRTEFEKRANKLICSIRGPLSLETPDVHVNGALTIGENISVISVD
jgi:putative endopeptidase